MVSHADWVFEEPPALGVFVTRQVFRDGAPIGLISHDRDGDWQFLHEEEEDAQRSVDDLLIVHLHHVVDRFPEVAQFANLPIGWVAWPEEDGSGWMREPQPVEWDERD
jgi:hypothetical protein